jgi:hypothetical protein
VTDFPRRKNRRIPIVITRMNTPVVTKRIHRTVLNDDGTARLLRKKA